MIRKYFGIVTQTIFGLFLLGFGALFLYREQTHGHVDGFHLLSYVGMIVLGGLILPTIGPAITNAALRGAGVVSLGRRAYDGKVVPTPTTEDNDG